jgi:glycosyltransferase involved in cell wall biosynthesis
MRYLLIRTSAIPGSLCFLLKGQLSFLNQNYEVIGVSSKGKEVHIVSEREGIKIKEIEIKRNIDLIKDLVSLYRLCKFFKRQKPFIVHSITPKAGLLSMIAARMCKTPIRIHTFTGLIFPTKRGIMQKILILTDRILCLCATHIYPEGIGVKNDLLKYNITNKPLKVLANGNVNGIDVLFFNSLLFSDIDKYTLKKKLDINDDDFVFIFVGRLVTDKGINELVKIFNEISTQYQYIKLLLVGLMEEDLDPLLPETVTIINHHKQIISVGWQSDVRPYFSIADILVFPSHREGFPNVVIQAGAMGLPSIVTDINGCNEIIIEDKNGVIIPPKDEEALREAMISLLTDKEKRKRMVAVSRQMIVERYEQKIVWEALLTEYKRLEAEYESKQKK